MIALLHRYLSIKTHEYACGELDGERLEVTLAVRELYDELKAAARIAHLATLGVRR
jgi:hypothetical protein